jgi:hypothetical protein
VWKWVLAVSIATTRQLRSEAVGRAVSAHSESEDKAAVIRACLLDQVEQLRYSLQVVAEVLLRVIHRVVSLVVVAPWVQETQELVSPATGRCRVLAALLRLVVQQRQRLTQGNSLEVVQVLRCLVRNFKEDGDVAHQR